MTAQIAHIELCITHFMVTDHNDRMYGCEDAWRDTGECKIVKATVLYDDQHNLRY